MKKMIPCTLPTDVIDTRLGKLLSSYPAAGHVERENENVIDMR